MKSSVTRKLLGWEIHGLHTIEDLDMDAVAKEASQRWLRPNEIYAILCNYEYFNVSAKPVDLPESGTLVLFDRKALRNFRKDGHVWQKKKDGKTVKEAHEHLKVGNEERIHVYYARGEDNPKFVRRIYWLLDKTYEHIVLVHYREVSEVNSKGRSPGGGTGVSFLTRRNDLPTSLPSTPTQSGLSPGNSASASLISSDERDSCDDSSMPTYLIKANRVAEMHANPGLEMKGTEELEIHQINTLDWDQLLETLESTDHTSNVNRTQTNLKDFTNCPGKTVAVPHMTADGISEDGTLPSGQLFVDGSRQKASLNSTCGNQSYVNGSQVVNSPISDSSHFESLAKIVNSDKDSGDPSVDHASYNEELNQVPYGKQDSFGKWVNLVLEDSPSHGDKPHNEDFVIAGTSMDSSIFVNDLPFQRVRFHIVEISPSWGISSEETKVIITGYFSDIPNNFTEVSWFCVFGDIIVPAEIVQPGVFRCMAPPHAAGVFHLYLTCNDQVPYSQVLSFEYRALGNNPESKTSFFNSDEIIRENFLLKIRLVHLLFSSFKGVALLESKSSSFAKLTNKLLTSLFVNMEGDWLSLTNMISEGSKSLEETMNHLFDLIIQKKLKEWLLEKAVDKGGAQAFDRKGQGVLHLIAALGYDWAIFPIKAVGICLNFRDKFGWTAMHWAAFHGREQTIAMLLAAGADSSMVTDPTAEAPGGWTAADMASKQGHEGLAGYLAEKSLTTQLSQLTLYSEDDPRRSVNLDEFQKLHNMSEDELSMKDALTGLRIATEAASKIHAAYREHAYRVKEEAFHAAEYSADKGEALRMMAALRIQRAFRAYYQWRRQFYAAKRIQHRFRGWILRREFVNLKKQVIKIQAYFRGHQARKQYRKFVWSVGVLEKAILRWRQRRKGLRGLQIQINVTVEPAQSGVDDEGMEDFFRIGRMQAEERVNTAVTRVQSMYRSYRARKDYKQLKEMHLLAMEQYDQIMGIGSHNMTD